MAISLVQILVLLIVCGLVWWASTRLIAAFGIGDPVKTVILVLVVILIITAVLAQIGLVHLPLRLY